MAYREIILAKTSEYVKIKKLSASGHGAIVMIDCPYCDTIKSAQFIRALGKIRCIHCQRSYNLLDLVRLVEDRETDDDETILNYLRDFLKIDVQTVQDSINLEQQLKIYQDRNWALVPCAKAANIGMAGERPMTGKEVIQPEWQKKENRDPADWYHWISSGLNIGVRTGSVSNLTIIDFDLLTKLEKAELVKPTTSDKRKAEIRSKKAIPDDLKAILGDTLMQESLGGFHCFYTYCPELRKTAFNHAGFHIDVENDGGQVIIPPSLRIGVDEEFEVNGDIKKRIVGYAGRAFINSSPIIPIPGSFLEWIKSKIDPQTKIEPEVISTSDIPAEFQIDDNFKVKDIQGNRNNTLISLGGIFRKELNSKQVHYVLRVLNKHVLESPLANGEIDHIMDGINKYCSTDADTLAIDIVNYLRDTDTASKTEIESAVFGGRTTSENKKRLDRTLMRLIQDEKIIKKNAREYRILKDMVWTTDLLNGGLPLNFKVPYFSDYASFNWGDNILVGGVQKVGKTHLSMNFLKRIAQQGIIPRYLYSENGGRHNKIALQLGLKPGDVEMTRCSNPADIIMRKQHSVYIYDWYRPRDFTRVGDDFELMAEKLDRSQSIMITLTQLREGSAKFQNQNDWFAKDQIRQYVAMSAKYIYEDKEGVNTFFDCNDIRESKTGQKMFKIPCKYNKASKEVQLREEVEQEERLKQITETPLLPEVQPAEEEKPKTIDDVKFDPNETTIDDYCDDCKKYHKGKCTTDVDGSPLTEPSETQTQIPTEESEEVEEKLDPGDR